MNIGLDIDGTLTKYPNELIALARAVRKDGGQVFIITSKPSLKAHNILKQMSREPFFDGVFCLETVEFNEQQIGKWKMRTCKSNRIDILFDDNANFRQYGKTPLFQVA